MTFLQLFKLVVRCCIKCSFLYKKKIYQYLNRQVKYFKPFVCDIPESESRPLRVTQDSQDTEMST